MRVEDKSYLVHVMIAVLLSYQESIRSYNAVIRTYAAFYYTAYYTSVVYWLSRLFYILFSSEILSQVASNRNK